MLVLEYRVRTRVSVKVRARVREGRTRLGIKG